MRKPEKQTLKVVGISGDGSKLGGMSDVNYSNARRYFVKSKRASYLQNLVVGEEHQQRATGNATRMMTLHCADT